MLNNAQPKTPVTNRGLKPETMGSIVSAGVDWLTVTTPHDNQGYALYDTAKNYWSGQGVKTKDWSNRWYIGRTGAGLSWGYGKQGYVIIASGQSAASITERVIIPKTRVTRIDLQVTVELNKPRSNVISDTYDDIVRQGRYKRRKYGIIKNTDKGATLYAGSRQSDQYGRFYDKGVESKLCDPGILFRYEVELKKPRSMTMASQLLERVEDGVFPQKDIDWYVYNWWYDRGVIPLYNPNRKDDIVTRAIRVETDTKKKLTWLQSQVRPTVGKLLDELGEEEVLIALGLSHLLS